MIKTQHCPNCEATEQKLHRFRREVSNAIEQADLLDLHGTEGAYKKLHRFIIPAPKPDPLVEVFAECDDGTWETKAEYADKFRAALKARGLEIREKNDGHV